MSSLVGSRFSASLGVFQYLIPNVNSSLMMIPMIASNNSNNNSRAQQVKQELCHNNQPNNRPHNPNNSSIIHTIRRSNHSQEAVLCPEVVECTQFSIIQLRLPNLW